MFNLWRLESCLFSTELSVFSSVKEMQIEKKNCKFCFHFCLKWKQWAVSMLKTFKLKMPVIFLFSKLKNGLSQFVHQWNKFQSFCGVASDIIHLSQCAENQESVQFQIG